MRRTKLIHPLVDEKCFDLAEHFMQDETHTEDDKWNLAAAIQQAIEDWYFSREHSASLAATGATDGDEMCACDIGLCEHRGGAICRMNR